MADNLVKEMVNLISADSRSSIGLTGEFLNVKYAPDSAYSSDGNVFAHVFIENRQGIYRAGLDAGVMDSNGDVESYLIPWDIVDTNIQLGVQYPMSIIYDAATKTITLAIGTTERQYTFSDSVDIYPLNVCESAGVRIDISTREDEGEKTIICEVDDVWVSENYDFFLGPTCPKRPSMAPIYL